VSDSVAAGNFIGFAAVSPSTAPNTLALFHSVAANNGTGLFAEGYNATARVAQSMVTGNTSASFVSTGGGVQTYDDNYFNSSAGNSGTLTPVNKQ
jgi:hypothetical protein